MRQRRAAAVLCIASILLAAPLLFSILRTDAAANNDSLVGYWKFEETLASASKTDASGDGMTGLPSGTVLPQPSANVAPTNFTNSSSLTFGNTNNAINVTTADSIDDLANFSVSTWLYPTSYAGESLTGRIIDKTNSLNGWSFYLDNGTLHFYANFSTSALHKVTTNALPLNQWSQVGVTWEGTELADGVKFYIDGVEQTSFATETDGVGTRVSDDTYNIIIGNNSALNRTFSGQMDELRLYNRQLADSEMSDIANGGHPIAVWTGGLSTDYETAGNWSTGAIPDAYAHARITDVPNQPVASANILLGGLTIDAGARLDMVGYNLGFNDGAALDNEGTLQLRNSQTLTNFVNDTDSGTVMITPVSDTTGLKTGNNYHSLIFNASTVAHWPLDETTGSIAHDVSGYEFRGTYSGGTVHSLDVAPADFANPASLEFDGIDSAVTFDEVAIPQHATWCAWVKATADGVILGGNTPGHYALAVANNGTHIRVYGEEGVDQAAWVVSDIRGSWHNLCVTQTTTVLSDLSLYIDGVSQGGSEFLSSPIGTASAIGSDTVDYFEGLIDDVRIYNRVLNGAEIVKIAAGEQPAISSVNRLTLSAPIDINGDLVLNGGIFDVSTSNHGINLAGDFINNSGQFQGRSGTVVLDGSDQLIHSTLNFYNLSKQVAAADTLTFGRQSITTVANQLTLEGVDGQLLSLRSSSPGVQWFIDPSGSESVGYLDVQDSNNVNAFPVDITNANVTDSGNNYNWTVNVAPDSPTGLGGTSYVDGSYVGDATPTLEFNLADSNPTDQLRYQVQIDNDSDFSSPVVDYTSALGAQGARSFTVGQTDTDDVYTVGADDMTLPTNDYYWRVRTIDDYTVPNQSSFTTANSGAVAFQLDVTPPTLPGVPETSNGMDEKNPTWTWDASADSGVGLGTPTYTMEWSTDVNFENDVTSQTTSNVSFTHGSPLGDGQWYFRVRAEDALGNQSAWATSTSHLIDTTGPSTPIAPNTSSPTNFNQPTWAWPEPTDAGIGLAAVPYIVQWSQDSSFSTGVSQDTRATNSYPHATSLADGTWYLRVRAEDALGNQSAWSSHGTVLIDTSPPSLPGAPYTDDPTNDSTPAWAWDSSIDEGVGLTPTPYFVQWSSSPGFTSTAGSTTVATNSYTHGGPLADGTWYIRVNARDKLSNQSAYSATGQVTIDTVAPDTPEAPTTTSPTNDVTPTWTWPVPDDEGVGLRPTPYDIEWSQDEEFNTVDGSASSATNSFTHSADLAEGTWYFRVRASDNADNTSPYSEPGSVWLDTTPPSTPGDPTTSDPVNEDQPTWIWLVSTDSGVGLADPAYQLEWSTDDMFEDNVISGTANTNSFTHNDPLVDGTWYFRVRAVDDVGNQSAWSNAGSKVVDIQPPTQPGQPTTESPTADNTPSWAWSASTDDGVGLAALPYLIEWSQDSDFLVGVQTDTIADADFTHSVALADGSWYFRVRAVDDVGNYSAYSSTGAVFVDATSPTTPGTPSTATPTTNDQPTWTWTASSDGSGIGLAENGYTVEWSTASDLSVDMQTATSDTNSFTHSTELADGTWYFRVRAVDDVGNVSADSPIASVEIDDTPPSIPGQASTPTPTNDTTPAWTWSASTDNGIGLRDPAYDIQWSLDGDFTGGVIADTTNTNSFTHSTELADGTWYFRVRAVDDLNNTSEWSDVGEVLLSTAGPSIPGQPTTNHPTTDTTPTWTWDASTADAGLADPAYHVEWSQDSDFLVGVETATSGTDSFTHSTELADGVWHFRLRAEDQTATFSLYSEIGTVRVDTTAPSVPDTLNTTDPTNDRTPTWTWDASTDAGVGLADPAYQLEWSQDSGFNSGVQSASSGTADFTHNDELSDGTWYLRIRASDSLSNQSAWSAVASVEIDATAPDVPGQPATTDPTNDRTPTWTWDASTDAGVGLADPAYQLEWSQDSGFNSGISSETTNGNNFTHDVDLADGTWHFRVRAVDDVGNQSAWSATGSVEVDRSAPTVPGAPTTGHPSTNDTTPAWTWSASTDSGVGLGTPAYEVQWTQDGDFVSGISSASSGSADYTHSSELSEGTWYFRVRAVDDVGNQSGYSAVGSVFVDTDTPSAPGTPSTDETPTSNRTPAWTWSASTDDGFGFGDEPYELQWSQDSNFVDGVETGQSAEESFVHTEELADGTWHFRVRAVDDAGNQSAWSGHGSVTVDASAPTVPGNLSTETPTKNATPTWTWDASTDAGVGLEHPTYTVEWTKDETFQTGIQTDTTDEPSYTHGTELGFGVWHFRVRAADTLGNTTDPDSAKSSVYIDSDPPVISAVTATPGSQGVLITWKTDEIASSQIEYGVADLFDQATAETDTSPRVTSHSVAITGLTSCSTYRFRIVSIDQLDNKAVRAPLSFTTTACSGNAAVTTQSTKLVSDAGGQASLNVGTAALQLQVPSGSVSKETDFQIKQLSPAPALGGIGQPAGRHLVGSHIYDLKALQEDNVVVTDFNGGLTVSITYSAAEAAGFTPSSFAIFRHNGTSWQQLDNCQANTVARVVSCQTSHFSVFGLFGERYVAPDPVPEGEGTVEPDPVPEIAPTKPQPEEEQTGQIEAASENRGLSATVTRAFKTIINRPVWWVSLLLLAISVVTLLVLKRRRGRSNTKKHVPYGIHKDD